MGSCAKNGREKRGIDVELSCTLSSLSTVFAVLCTNQPTGTG